MKAYVIVPLVLLAGFGTFYVLWSAKNDEEIAAQTKQAIARIAQEKNDLLGGKAFMDRDGKKEAEADISHGAPKLLLYGKTGGDIAERTFIFRERFGITIDPLAGCMVSDPLVAFADAYNSAVQTHIAEKFGPTAFEDAARDALHLWESKKKKANQTPEPTPGTGVAHL